MTEDSERRSARDCQHRGAEERFLNVPDAKRRTQESDTVVVLFNHG